MRRVRAHASLIRGIQCISLRLGHVKTADTKTKANTKKRPPENPPDRAGDSTQRQAKLVAKRNAKMTRSVRAYVRGSTTKFYEWLNAADIQKMPQGPAIWICGDCHTGNLGPVADAKGNIEIQIRDLDQTVIGNPAHDLIRLGLSLATAARGSDLPGVPRDNAERVVEGARHLSPYLGERMRSARLMGKPVVIRELLPQDLKLEVETLAQSEAMDVARYLAYVVGKAHARQMDDAARASWLTELRRNRTKTLDAPSWLWSSIVELISSHEAAYLEHCRRYAMARG